MKHIIRGWIALFMTLVALGGSTTASSYTIDTTSSPSVLTGLWWNANESGWGLTVTQQYGIIFVAMYTYDTTNNPICYVNRLGGFKPFEIDARDSRNLAVCRGRTGSRGDTLRFPYLSATARKKISHGRDAYHSPSLGGAPTRKWRISV